MTGILFGQKKKKKKRKNNNLLKTKALEGSLKFFWSFHHSQYCVNQNWLYNVHHWPERQKVANIQTERVSILLSQTTIRNDQWLWLLWRRSHQSWWCGTWELPTEQHLKWEPESTLKSFLNGWQVFVQLCQSRMTDFVTYLHLWLKLITDVKSWPEEDWGTVLPSRQDLVSPTWLHEWICWHGWHDVTMWSENPMTRSTQLLWWNMPRWSLYHSVPRDADGDISRPLASLAAALSVVGMSTGFVFSH